MKPDFECSLRRAGRYGYCCAVLPFMKGGETVG
jgi:hypothetical protein